MNNSAVTATWIFASIFMWITFLEFSSNFFPGEKAFFETNSTLSLIHFTTAICLIIVTRTDEKTRIQSMQMFGMAYMLISGIGFMGMNIQIGEQWENVIYLNLLNYLQFGLGIALSVFGTILKKRQRLAGSMWTVA